MSIKVLNELPEYVAELVVDKKNYINFDKVFS
jgi:hypothetical protein